MGSGIIFEFHYNFIIFFLRLGSTILYKKFQFFFTPYTPQKMTILAKFGHFGTFWIFFDHLYPPKKTKKILYWHNFAILAFFGTFGIFFTPYNPQNEYFDKIWPFWHFLALFRFFFTPYTPKKPKKWIFWQNLAILPLFSTFLGGGQNCQKKDNVI